MRPSRLIASGIAIGVAALLTLPVVACAARAPTPRSGATQFYVSLGDSYATGYQPSAEGGPGAGTRDGFAYQLPRLAARKGWRLRLVQFGCGGATTTSLLRQRGCPTAARGPQGRPYRGRTQLAASVRFIRRHRDRVGLITLSIGGNDVTPCVQTPNPTLCVADAVGPMGRNLAKITRRLRRAAGPKVRIVGLTYPNVILGAWLAGPQGRELATLSVGAFRTVINPTLARHYRAIGATFVDVTEAAGGDIPLEQTTILPGVGTVPVAVARVCELTWFCAAQDIHARASGYRLIAQLVARTLPRKRAATRRAHGPRRARG